MASLSLTADAQACVLACTQLGAARGGAAELRTFTSAEWSALLPRIAASVFESPGGLLGQPVQRLQEELGLSTAEAERLHLRLSRGAQLAVEFERLAAIGIWILTTADEPYPRRLATTLGRLAPVVLFGVGDRSLLSSDGVAVVGSRHIDDDVIDYAAVLGRQCVSSGLTVVSGAARGVDRAAMSGALGVEGHAIGVVADSLIRLVRSADLRRPAADGRLALVSPYHPDAGFSVGAAMGRNKVIYGLARWGVVVESTKGEGGTWAGAKEVLRHRWVPLFVRQSGSETSGNRALLRLGAWPFPTNSSDLPADLLPLLEQPTASAAAPKPAKESTDVQETSGTPASRTPVVEEAGPAAGEGASPSATPAPVAVQPPLLDGTTALVHRGGRGRRGSGSDTKPPRSTVKRARQ